MPEILLNILEVQKTGFLPRKLSKWPSSEAKIVSQIFILEAFYQLLSWKPPKKWAFLGIEWCFNLSQRTSKLVRKVQKMTFWQRKCSKIVKMTVSRRQKFHKNLNLMAIQKLIGLVLNIRENIYVHKQYRSNFKSTFKQLRKLPNF